VNGREGYTLLSTSLLIVKDKQRGVNINYQYYARPEKNLDENIPYVQIMEILELSLLQKRNLKEDVNFFPLQWR